MNINKKEIFTSNKNSKIEIIFPKSEGIILNLNATYKHILPGKFSGKFNFDKSGFFTSDVVDSGSSVYKQVIKGYFSNQERITKLSFLKSPEVSTLAGLYYFLEKINDGDLCGNYMGKWYALPYNFRLSLTEISIDKMEDLKKEIHFLGISNTAEVKISLN